MARKSNAQLDLGVPEDPAEQGTAPDVPVPRRIRAKSEPAPKRSRLRLVLRWTGGFVALAAAVVVPYQIDQFLASDAHFILPGPAQSKGNANFAVEGVVYTPPDEVTRVFNDDFGRSVYLMPLTERRRALLRIDWIRDASISRRWPNRLLVRIVERRPVAFLMLPAAGTYEAALIDGEGVILRRPERARLSLPVLYGITRAQSPAVRRARMMQVGKMMQEFETYARQLSEIDVSNPEDIVVTQAVQGRAVRLRLGDRNYRERLESFLRNYGDISKRLPNARTFDLRLDNYFTAEDGGANAR